MNEGWRQTLSMYVNQYNRDQVNYEGRQNETKITDLNYLLKSGDRKARLSSWYEARGATPLRNETKAKLISQSNRGEGEVEIDLQLARNTSYEKGGISHQEQIVEHHQLILQRDGQDWLITKVFIFVPEAKSVPQPPIQPLDEETPTRIPAPFLNTGLLGYSGRSIAYRRQDAVAYADRWWDSFNPEFAEFEVNCTNYVSQCLFAGGAPINYTGKRETGWWYKGYVNGQEQWSYSWAVSAALERYLSTSTTGLRATVVERAEQLELGDVIFYDWDGDGRYQHSTIVTAFDAGGMPLVNANTVPSRHRYWDYKDSYAWTEQTVYRFFHIADWF
ncbi:hypothetical protein J2Z32_002808 [Paenibacillus turicensis]|uniref:Putative amidase domain-containing protein n=1 Tax=Paenibacillus turicensis TaxID=160487 RepID=A0ABS4FUD7_9BACL|nr:amidase domain-containing protein [Paenibacillus turicensis]MBP1906159.1 hypothetical protein [Paenibacillus turicensis]